MVTDSSARRSAQVPAVALLPYLIIAFGLPWSLLLLYVALPDQLTARLGEISASHPAFILAVWSPAIAAFALVLYYGGAPGLRSFLSRLLLWRCPVAWYVYLFVGFPLVFVAGSAIKGNLFSEPVPFDGLLSLLAAMGFMLVLGPMEEFGWRGVALPLLQRWLAPFAAGLVLGMIWGLWHLPAFLLSGTPQSSWEFMPFFVGSVCLSVILTPLFNASCGSILVAVVYHFQANNPLWPDAQPYDSYLLVAVAVIVVWLNRRTVFSREGAVTAVIPVTAGGAGR
ncbi:MAG: CPBP family intramembrane glutamic endopeptidase [Pseudomonadales bacterium]